MGCGMWRGVSGVCGCGMWRGVSGCSMWRGVSGVCGCGMWRGVSGVWYVEGCEWGVWTGVFMWVCG